MRAFSQQDNFQVPLIRGSVCYLNKSAELFHKHLARILSSALHACQHVYIFSRLLAHSSACGPVDTCRAGPQFSACWLPDLSEKQLCWATCPIVKWALLHFFKLPGVWNTRRCESCRGVMQKQTLHAHAVQESKWKLTPRAVTTALYLLLFCHVNNQCSFKKLKYIKTQEWKLKPCLI